MINIEEFNIDEIIQSGRIKNELELERASRADRKLRLMSKEFPSLKIKRNQVRKLINEYELSNWTNRDKITDAQIAESDSAEEIVQLESEFVTRRKKLILSKLKRLGLNQQEFGSILGHNSKSYTSELMNGVVPFTLKDLVVISKLLKINLNRLIPTYISAEDKIKIQDTIAKLDNPKLRLKEDEFAFV